MKVLVWNEYYHEQSEESIREIYPEGIHTVLKSFLECDDIRVRCATLYDENCGITPEILADTDVMLWWGHCKHSDVPDAVVDMVQEAVLRGMGIIFLHSAHKSKPFMRLLGMPCTLCWRDDDSEILWVVDPSHPITQGIDRYIKLPNEEMYGEPFGVPEPEKVLFMGWFKGGEVFRSGCTWQRGAGKIFYFQPGHEAYPIYYNPEIQTVIKNAVRWAYNPVKLPPYDCPNTLEKAAEK